MATLGQYNLDEMDAIEVIEAARGHLLGQNERSMSLVGGECLYFGGKNLVCAAGIFIQNYDPKMEGMRWDDLIIEFDESKKHAHLIEKLQEIHDMHLPEEWSEMITDIKEGGYDA